MKKKMLRYKNYIYEPRVHKKIIIFYQLGLIFGLVYLMIEILMDYFDILMTSCNDLPEKDSDPEKDPETVTSFLKRKFYLILTVAVILSAAAYVTYCFWQLSLENEIKKLDDQTQTVDAQTQTVDDQTQTVDAQTQTEVFKVCKNTTRMSTIIEHDLLKREEFRGNNNVSVTSMGFYQEAFNNVKKPNSNPDIAAINENLADEAAKWYMDHRLFGNVEPKYLKKACKRILTNPWRFGMVDIERAKEYRDFLKSNDRSKRDVVSLIYFLRKIYGMDKLDECLDDDDDEAIDDDASSSSSFAQKDE